MKLMTISDRRRATKVSRVPGQIQCDCGRRVDLSDTKTRARCKCGRVHRYLSPVPQVRIEDEALPLEVK